MLDFQSAFFNPPSLDGGCLVRKNKNFNALSEFITLQYRFIIELGQ